MFSLAVAGSGFAQSPEQVYPSNSDAGKPKSLSVKPLNNANATKGATVAQQPAAPVSADSLPVAKPVETRAEQTPQDVNPLEQAPIQYYDEQKAAEGAQLLNTVLTASVIKVQEYPVDLQTVLKLVEAQNLPLLENRLTAKIQSNQYYRSVAEILPDIEGTYNQSRFQGVVQIFGSQTIPVYQTRLVPQLTARWLINPGGYDVFNALAARQRAKEAKIQVQATTQEQMTQAASDYFQLIAAGIQVSNAKVNIQEAQSQVALSEARLKAGVGTKLDLVRSKTQLLQREQGLISAENTLAQAQQTLLSLLNLDPDIELIPPQVAAQPHPLVPLTVNTEQLTARAVANNPNLKAVDAEIKALGFDAKATLSKLVPSVTLQTYINGTGPEIDKLGLGRFGGFTLQANLFDKLGTAIPLDYRTRRLQVQRKVLERQQQLRDIQTQVIKAYLDSRAAAKAIFVTQNGLAEAQEAHRLAIGRFRAGLGINVDVLNAQTALAAARVSVVNAILDFNTAQVALLNSLGEVSIEHVLNGIKPDVFTQTPPARKP